MANQRESLCDLIETRSAQHGIPRRKLWAWAFAAILDGTLVPANASDFPLDTVLNHGGMYFTWRGKVADALQGVSQRRNLNPSNLNWTANLTFSKASFDSWLKMALSADDFPPRPKRRAGAKGNVRAKIKQFVDENYPQGVPPGVTNKDIAKQASGQVGRVVHERTVTRALGGK
jgi:hypothetical protein